MINLGEHTILTISDNDAYDKKLAFKNNAPFTSCISKENLDVIVPLYNLLHHNKNYKKTTGSLFNYYRD